ncbi:MAG TPA: hypothetical protein VIM93_11495 [Kangiella sp.]
MFTFQQDNSQYINHYTKSVAVVPSAPTGGSQICKYTGSLKVDGEINMSMKKLKYLVGSLFAFIISGCAGIHPKPPSDYYSSNLPERTVRVAFDQNGHIYPLSTEKWDWNAVQPAWWCKVKGCSFQLKKVEDNEGGNVYDPEKDRLHYTKEVIDDLNKILEGKEKLAIFIHGFNNNYDDAQCIYKQFRSKIDDIPVLEVYWDGVENNVPIKIWFPALTYSNLAGQIGLRSILNGIKHPIDVSFVTHSRGAAVAVSAISNPIYDPGIEAPQEEDDNKHKFLGYSEPNFGTINDVSFVFFAPAIGNGHFWPGIDEFLPDDRVAHFYFGTNPDDFATSKSIVPSQAFGDTSLGGNQDAINLVKSEYSENNELINIQQEKFIHGSEHGIPGYFSPVNGSKPECMLWASGLRKEKPNDCKLTPVK